MSWTQSVICYLYFVFVGVCYLLGFWTPLHFNVLDFLSPVDMLKSATYPVIPAALGIFFLVLIDSFNSQGVKKPEHDDPKIIKVIFWIVILLILFLISINVLSLTSHLYHLFTASPEKRLTYALPAASIIGTSYFVYKPPFLAGKHKFIRNFVIIFMCTLPSVSYFQGNKNITNILAGRANYYYLKDSSKSCRVDNKSKMIYLGFYGANYLFINSTSRDLCIERDGGVLLSYHISPGRLG